LPTVYVPNSLSKHLRRGHPWVYRDRLSRAPELPSGTWVKVQCGSFAGYGLWDAESPIAVRVYSHRQVPDATWVGQQIDRAWALRAPLREAGHSAYRWLYGEGDGLPGLVVDLYETYAVIATYAESVSAVLDWTVKGLRACTELKGILLHGEDVAPLWGRRPPRGLVVVENDLRFHVDLYVAQKTGLYLDHRDNRRYLEPWCAGKRVLNCFAYTGAFTLYAVRGGASEVISVDIAPGAVAEIGRNLSLNGYDADAHPALIADCFELLVDYAERGEQFDVVVLDPPALARSKRSYHAAMRAYTHLNQAAMRCLAPGGLLATASCTAQVSAKSFHDMLAQAAARAGRRLTLLHQGGQAMDHPVPAHFPEGRYLKFALGRVEQVT
jgi:23S rRNA (cytosine1962-C5)-methyltransferase